MNVHIHPLQSGGTVKAAWEAQCRVTGRRLCAPFSCGYVSPERPKSCAWPGGGMGHCCSTPIAAPHLHVKASSRVSAAPSLGDVLAVGDRPAGGSGSAQGATVLTAGGVCRVEGGDGAEVDLTASSTAIMAAVDQCLGGLLVCMGCAGVYKWGPAWVSAPVHGRGAACARGCVACLVVRLSFSTHHPQPSLFPSPAAPTASRMCACVYCLFYMSRRGVDMAINPWCRRSVRRV
jgi:hypothetical protein